jgi:predicted nucleic acid-binding Zn finger protein
MRWERAKKATESFRTAGDGLSTTGSTGAVLSAPGEPTGVSDGDGGTDGGADADDAENGSTDSPADASDGVAPPEETAEEAAPSEDLPDKAAPSEDIPGEPASTENASDGETDYAVPTATESDAETAWRRALTEAGELTPSAVDTLVGIHDDRGTRAIEAVSEGRVKRYRDFTVVVGHEDEYVVEDGGCTCKDSSYNLDPEDPEESCWHVLAVAIAERIGEVDHHEMWYSEVRDFL